MSYSADISSHFKKQLLVCYWTPEQIKRQTMDHQPDTLPEILSMN